MSSGRDPSTSSGKPRKTNPASFVSIDDTPPEIIDEPSFKFLNVEVLECKDLRSCDTLGGNDVYVELHLGPEKKV